VFESTFPFSIRVHSHILCLQSLNHNLLAIVCRQVFQFRAAAPCRPRAGIHGQSGGSVEGFAAVRCGEKEGAHRIGIKFVRESGCNPIEGVREAAVREGDSSGGD
jgi:hypothetical protein